MYYRIPEEFMIEVKKVDDINIFSSEYRSETIEREDPFIESDEEYINANINK